jgi:signal transduction histidine kinase/ActR/RegA family two-component response regulator
VPNLKLLSRFTSRGAGGDGPPPAAAAASLPFLQGGGVCGALVRSIDWSQTTLGPPAQWPSTLKTTVATMLHSRHPMFLWWGDELIQFYNDGYLPSFGQGKHPAAMGQRGADCWAEIWPLIWPQIDDVMRRCKASWNEDQLVPIFRNGKIEDVYWTYGYSPVIDESGSVAGTLVVCTETTPRVLAERRLHSILSLSEATAAATEPPALYQAAAGALAHCPDDIPFAVIYSRGPEGSMELESAHGLAPEARAALDGRIRAKLAAIAENPHAHAGSELLPALAEGPETGAYLVALSESAEDAWGGCIAFGLSPRLPLDEAYRDYLLHLAAIVSQGLARQHAHAERERLLREVKSEQERLRSLFAQAPAFMCAMEGPRHVFALANERYYQLIGRRDIIGKPIAEAVPEAASQGFFELLDGVYRTGESFFGHDMPVQLARHPAQPPELRYVDFVYQATRGADGAISGILVHGIDQTERRLAAQAMQEADRRKDEFLALLAHELRNPLAPIRTYARALERLAGDPQAVKQAVVVLNRQVDQMVRLIDDLLDVSRIGSGKVELRKARTDIASVVRQAVEAARPFYEERGIELAITMPGQPVHVHGDAARLAQIAGNLLHNAAKFTERGGHVQLTVEREGNRMRLRVRDDGIGIAPEALTNIFTMFTQADTSLEREHGGLGIGLALVRSFVELHGGSVEAHSEGLGAGAEFIVRLPLLPSERGARDTPLHAPANAARATSILVVDDNRDGCDSMAALLRAGGHQVRTAYDGAAALAEAADFRPRIILMDLGMPKMNGYEACQRIRDQTWGKQPVVIALTGWGQEADKQRAKQAGFDAHLVKPVDPDALDQLLELRDFPARTGAAPGDPGL